MVTKAARRRQARQSLPIAALYGADYWLRRLFSSQIYVHPFRAGVVLENPHHVPGGTGFATFSWTTFRAVARNIRREAEYETFWSALCRFQPVHNYTVSYWNSCSEDTD